jgi:hypothetical protein
MMPERQILEHPLLWLAGAGLMTGLGNLLASEEKLTWRIVTGRCISSAALGAAAGTALMWVPDIPDVALIGLSCTIASLGTSGLERLLQKAMGK